MFVSGEWVEGETSKRADIHTANQFLVFRVTMTDVEYASYINAVSPVPSGLTQLRQRIAANAKRLAGFY